MPLLPLLIGSSPRWELATSVQIFIEIGADWQKSLYQTQI